MTQLHLLKKSKTTSKRAKSPGRPRTRPEDCFGGSYHKSYNPNEQRPISSKKALHLVLRSSLAKGKYSMNRPELQAGIWEIIEKHARKNNICLYEFANAGNHLHLLIRVKRRDDYCRFVRSITGLIARAVKGCEKGSPLNGKFWDARPFTRIVSFAGGQFKKVKMYIARNRLEALGFVRYQPRPRGKRSSEWRAFWAHYYLSPP